MKNLQIVVVLTFSLCVFRLTAQTWTPAESSHFGMDGFESADFFRLTPLQLDDAYRWEASGLKNMSMAWNRTLSPTGGQFRWNVIEAVQGTYDWSKPDAFVNRIQAEGLQLLVLVHPYAQWDQPTKTDMNYDKPNNMTAFKRFIAKLVERYDGDGVDDMPGLLYPIKYYEIGNEPESQTFGDAPGTYNDFMETVKAARDTAKIVYPDVKIVIAGATPIYDSRQFLNQVDLFWKGALNRSNAGSYFDIFNFHFFVGEYSQDISVYIDYWKQILSAYGLSGKEMWLTETGTYSGTASNLDGTNWPIQSTSYQAGWWIKQASYALANGVSKLFWVFYYSDQTDWRSKVAFVNIDKTTKKAVYYTHKLMADKIDAYSSALQNAYAASGQSQTSGNFKFMVDAKPVYIVWNDQGGNANLTGLNSGKVKITNAVPTLDGDGNVILDGTGNPAFQTTESNVTGGQATITLSSIPVYVEEIISAPSAPILASPSNGTTGISISPNLSWDVSTEAISYRLQVSKDSFFTMIVYEDSTITTTSKQVALENGTTYFWKVNAKNEGGTSGYSSTWNFTTIKTAPNTPTLVTPVNSATDIPKETTLLWNSSLGADTYRLQIAKDSLFTIMVIDDSTITNLFSQVSLDNSTTYFWRVNAKNEGGTSIFSSTWSFTTIISAPDTPILLSPADETTNISTLTTFTWNAAIGASSFRLQVSQDSTFTSTVFDDSTITGTSKQVQLMNNAKYFWRMLAKNAGGLSPWSNVYSFTTIILAPIIPSLVYPSNNQKNLPVEFNLIWNKVNYADTYSCQIANDSNFNQIMINDTIIIDTIKQITLAIHGKKHYWKIRANNSGGSSQWSNTWNFLTILPSPNELAAIPNLLNSITLTWKDKSNGEVGFILERNQDSTNYSVIDTTQSNDTVYVDTNVEKNRTYYYKIKSFTYDCESDYSNETSAMVTKINKDELPKEYSLSQNFPNPFNPVTSIQFTVGNSPAGEAGKQNVSLKVFDVLGREVAVLINEKKEPGTYTVKFDASQLGSGIYIYRIKANNFSASRKLVLLR